MLFKFKLWEMFENPRVSSNISESSTHSFLLNDDYEEKMCLSFLQNIASETIKLYGQELNVKVLEERLLGLDLFQGSSFFVILKADKLNKVSQQFLIENLSKITGHKIVFIFQGENELFKSLKKNTECNLFQVEQPAFYEIDRVLSYLGRKAGYHFDEDTLQYLLDLIPPEMAKFWALIEMLKVYFPQTEGLKKLTRTELAEYLTPDRLDQFHFSTLLSQKNLYKFYRELAHLNFEPDIWRRTLPFFTSHLRKLFNPSYAKKKNKPSKYDKEILACTKLWDEKSLLEEIDQLAKLDIIAKIQPTELKNSIRQRYLKEII